MMPRLRFEFVVMIICFLLLVWLIISGVRGAKGAEVLTLTETATGIILSWNQPQQFDEVCIHRYAHAGGGSAKCSGNTRQAGPNESQWLFNDEIAAFRPAQGDRYVLCYPSVGNDGYVCRPVAEVYYGPAPTYTTYLSLISAQGPGTPAKVYEVRLSVIRR